jgi:hypothetical protein
VFNSNWLNIRSDRSAIANQTGSLANNFNDDRLQGAIGRKVPILLGKTEVVTGSSESNKKT